MANILGREFPLSKYHDNRDECVDIVVRSMGVNPMEAYYMVDNLFEHMVETYIGEWDFEESNIIARGLGIELYFEINPILQQDLHKVIKLQ